MGKSVQTRLCKPEPQVAAKVRAVLSNSPKLPRMFASNCLKQSSHYIFRLYSVHHKGTDSTKSKVTS